MKFTLNWLKQFLETDANLQEISEKLTAIGLEVEEITDKTSDLADFKIAQIMDAQPHPDADKLRVCKVNTGEEQIQIVCGAPNARAGINVVLAPVGSIIPTNGMKIRASKIRGVESFGMLCSAAELGLGTDSDGIIEMPVSNDNIAQNYAKIAGLDDPIIEIAITPNRGDCLGVYGIARDLAAAGLGTLKPLDIPQNSGDFKSEIAVNIADKTECPLFVGRHFKNLKNAQSPDWLQNRLNAIGIKPKSALVDITNYITFEFGRPLHVYDAKKIDGALDIRSAKAGEKFTSLEDKEYNLNEKITVVADNSQAQAIGGVIGGAASGCTDSSDEIFLEVALFNPISVANSGRKLDIITDSRYRFERSVDSQFVMDAAEITTKMILDICGGTTSELVISGKVPEFNKQINFDFDYVKARSGVDISQEQSSEILTSLGFIVDGNIITVPSWRSDVEGKADIVEEIIRIFGFENIPSLKLPESSTNDFTPVLSSAQKRVSNARRSLASRSMVEAISWSFMKSDKAEFFGKLQDSLRLQNPISHDLDCMRPSILPNLIDAVARNNARGVENLAFFEIGLIFESTKPEGQRQVLAGLREGKTSAKNIYGTSRDVDIFDAKADCLAALKAAGAPVGNLRITADAPAYFHPGRSGVLRLGKNSLAYFGEIHPSIAKEFYVKNTVVAFEIFFDTIPAAKAKKSKTRPKLQVSEYQSSTRDFAFLINAEQPVAEILKAISTCDKKLIEDVSLFDIYQGKGVEDGKKSIAISVKICASDRTLTENDLEEISNKVIAAATKSGGVLRG